MTDAQLMEQFSVYLAKMMASLSGCVIGTTNMDEGVDFSVKQSLQLIRFGRTRHLLSGAGVDIQMKTTTNILTSKRPGQIAFDLDIKTYNDLIQRKLMRTIHGNSIKPLLLVLHCLPKDRSLWMKVEKEGINMKGSLFWYYPDEMGRVAGKTSSKRIVVPIENQVNLEFFKDVFTLYF